MLAKWFMRDRNSSVSVMFAAGAIPMVGLIGLAVDFGIWNQTNSALSVAANVAALTALKVAVNEQLQNVPTFQTDGVAAGERWFASEVGINGKYGPELVTLNGGNATVTVNQSPCAATDTCVTVNYTGYVYSVFGSILFGIPKYGLNGSATATVSFAPYLNVEMLLDNSSSMDIGATVSDMQTLQQISACDASNAVYPATAGIGVQPQQGAQAQSLDPYNSYIYSNGSESYALYTDTNGAFIGPLAAPVVLTPPTYPVAPKITLTQNASANWGPQCVGYTGSYKKDANNNNIIPWAGPPCEFACHWDNAHGNSGYSQDLYGAARRTLQTPNAVTLRFDEVKTATNQILQAMQQDDLAINNLNVGIFTFNTALNRVYPASGEAGDDWATAIADVGLPPSGPYVEETGILPVIGQRQNVPNDDTNIVEAMNSLTGTVLTTPSGNGTKPSTPRKVLFLITDGFMDDNSQGRSAFPSTLCSYLKNTLNYTIYVVFTPYYPIEHEAYVGGYGTIINSTPGVYTQPGTLAYGLAQCASSTSDIISAQNQTQLSSALQSFLLAALQQPAVFTK